MKRAVVSFGLMIAVLFGMQGTPAMAQSTDSFTISDYKVEMWLDKDDENRSTLKTMETITADFPQSDQNHGLEKVFVKEYNNHPTGLQLQSVTNMRGVSLPHHWNGDTLRIGDKNTYVHGPNTYKITYTQRDVTRYYADTNKDEFYWDVIGTEWRVPITSATITIHLSAKVRDAAEGQPVCYQGVVGSNQRCVTNMSGGQISGTVFNLKPKEGVTIAIGFTKGTFAEYKMSAADIALMVAIGVGVVLQALGLILAIIGSVKLYQKRKQLTETPEILGARNRATIPEYLPPKEQSVLDSAVAYEGGVTGKAATAQLIDWAVRHYVDIRQTKEKSFWSSAEYTFEVKKTFEDTSQNENELAKILFATEPQIGTTVSTKELSKRSYKITSALSGLGSKVKAGSDLFSENAAVKEYQKKVYKRSMIGFGAFLLSIPLLIVAVVAYTLPSIFKTQKGEELKKYLEGLKMYIGVAEEERLKMLQTPEGAEKVGEVSEDKGARLKLYEKVLPYAILFGQEKQWAAELGKLYEETGTTPDWSPSTTAFNAAMFSTMMSDVSSGVTSASSYSSSSGGSSGGGSSGGGGGGGGGGGW